MVKGDSGGDAGVEAVDVAVLGDAGDGIGFVEDELADAFVLAADDEEEGAGVGEGDVGEKGFAVHVEGDDAVADFAGAFDVAGAVGGADDVEVFGGAGAGFDDGGVDVGGAAEGHEDGGETEEVGGAEDGAGVAGVFDVVEEEEAGLFEDAVVEVGVGEGGGDEGGALVLFAAAGVEEVLFGDGADGDAGVRGGAGEGGEAFGGGVCVEEEFEAGAAAGAEGFEAGVDAVEGFLVWCGGSQLRGPGWEFVDKCDSASKLVSVQCNPIREDFRMKYDAVLVVSFGGPEGMEEVMPFLDNVLRGKGVPEERKLEVAHHYELFGGVSPINAQNRELVAALETALPAAGVDVPVLLANRNTPPYIPDVLETCMERGYEKVLVYITSGFSCYSGCRQYRENLMTAQAQLGEKAPKFDKIRVFFNHPLFIETVSDKVAEALALLPVEQRAGARVVFTAHSIPMAMANTSAYTEQLGEAARLVAERLELPGWDLVYQSRSGPPQVPWLEPDICDHLDALKAEGVPAVVVSPLGFVSDHMEVLFDLDLEARDHAAALGLGYVRASTPGNDPRMVEMIVELIRERALDLPERRAIGRLPPKHDVCPENCCPAIKRPIAR